MNSRPNSKLLNPMPTFNHAQLTAFLNALNEPAQLYDVRGNLVAENLAARTVEWPDENGSSKSSIHTIDVGEGWFIRRMDSMEISYAPARLSGHTIARPNLQALMSGITHELRNPLAAILTAISLLQDDASLPEETVMLLNVVCNESRRMNKILSEFSLYVKLPQPQTQDFKFTQLAHQTVDELKSNGSLRDAIKIETHLPESLSVCADPVQTQQLLSRLLQNAAQALEEQIEGVITLRSYMQKDTSQVVICIEDNGPGFSEDELKQAFLPFYSTKPQGVGLGLSIAQVVVQAAGGAIWLENLQAAPPSKAATENLNLLSGARVCFSLPSQVAEI